MKQTQRWLAPVLAVALIAGAISPATVFAGKGGRPIDLPGDPPIDPGMYEYGDPEPGSGGLTIDLGDLGLWRMLLLDYLSIRLWAPTTDRFNSAISVRLPETRLLQREMR